MDVPPHARTLVGDVLSDGPELLKSLDKEFRRGLERHGAIDHRTQGDGFVSLLRVVRSGPSKSLAPFLAPGGNFVCKIFQGAEFKEFADAVKNSFETMKIFKPSEQPAKAARKYM